MCLLYVPEKIGDLYLLFNFLQERVTKKEVGSEMRIPFLCYSLGLGSSLVARIVVFALLC